MNKTIFPKKILTIAPIMAAALLLLTPLLGQSVSASKGHGKIDFSQSNLDQPYFSMDRQTGTTTWSSTPITTDHSTLNSASAAKSDSASSANSQNNVKCFAFCLGVSTANSGSAADSDSRTNSPGDTATAMPVSPTINSQAAPFEQPDTPQSLDRIQQENPFVNKDHNNHHKDHNHPITNDILGDNGITYPYDNNNALTIATTGGTACIDNTGSAQDMGYAQGYVDGNRDSAGLNGHGFDDSLKGNHTPEFRQGYHDGYHSGFVDGNKGINLQQC